MKRLSVDELTRLAFIHAECDRESYALCYPAGSAERAEALELCAQLKRYRLKRWGKTRLEAVLEGCTSVPIQAFTAPPTNVP